MRVCRTLKNRGAVKAVNRLGDAIKTLNRRGAMDAGFTQGISFEIRSSTFDILVSVVESSDNLVLGQLGIDNVNVA